MNMTLAVILLVVAIITEIIGTTFLPAAEGWTRLKPSIISILSYACCWFCIGLCLQVVDLGVLYGTWAALGTAVTPLIGYVFYKQRTTKAGLIGVAFILAGILLLNLMG